MEDNQRDLEKEIAAWQPSKPTRGNRQWTLLFLGNHGQVVTIRWFRPMVVLVAFLLALTTLAGGAFYYLYRHTRHVNEDLRQSLDHLQRQVVGLRSDKEALVAQLVLSGAEIEKIQAWLDPQQVEESAGDRREGTHPDGEAAGQSEAAVSAAEEPVISSKPSVDSAAAQKRDPRVSIEKFDVSHQAADHTFKAQFIIRKTGSDPRPVSGYTAVILKKMNTQPDKWLTLPTLKLDDGVPTGDKPGQYFSIARFKTVRFSVKNKMDPQQFDSADVYVFDEHKHLLLKQDFPIRLQ